MYFYISSSSLSSKEMNMALNSFCSKECVKGIRDGKLQCHCGEDVGDFHWYWSKSNSSSNIRISKNNRDILFHPLFSSGTAVVRGDLPFQPNLHHYWEVKMISNLYGTDVMVGVGTSKIAVSDWEFKFCSMLGLDSQSWGYSYYGNIQHNNLRRKYGSEFGLGSIIGVHLDMCKGTLEYHINRKPLGIAFTGLRGSELYPMVSSTAAQSAIRIVCSVSEESTLQMLCLRLISKHPLIYQKYKEIPGLTRLYEKKYFWIVPTDEDEVTRLAKVEDDLMCPLNYKNFLKRNKTYHSARRTPSSSPECEGDDVVLSGLETSDDESVVYAEDKKVLYDSDSSTEEIYPSTSKQICDETRNKIRRTDSFVSHTKCSGHEAGTFCAKCDHVVKAS